jgi:hypothetical protein
MAKGKKTGGRDFVKGYTPVNPGQPSLPPEIRKIALKTKKEALARLGEMLQKPFDEVVEIFRDGSLSSFDHVLAALIVHAKKGSARHMQEMLDRLYGKVQEQIEVTHTIKPKVMVLPTLGQTINVEFEDKPTEELEEAKE